MIKKIKLILVSAFLISGCSSLPKNAIIDHNFQLTCEVGSRYYFFNLRDLPKKGMGAAWVSENAWYITTATIKPDFSQKPSVTFGPPKQNKKRFLQKPYLVTNDMFFFTTFNLEWELNRINMQAIMVDRLDGRNVMTSTCEYGFRTEQFDK